MLFYAIFCFEQRRECLVMGGCRVNAWYGIMIGLVLCHEIEISDTLAQHTCMASKINACAVCLDFFSYSWADAWNCFFVCCPIWGIIFRVFLLTGAIYFCKYYCNIYHTVPFFVRNFIFLFGRNIHFLYNGMKLH